jgi:hypothetical protein
MIAAAHQACAVVHRAADIGHAELGECHDLQVGPDVGERMQKRSAGLSRLNTIAHFNERALARALACNLKRK